MKLYVAETWRRYEGGELVGVYSTPTAAVKGLVSKMKECGWVFEIQQDETLDDEYTYHLRQDKNPKLIFEHYAFEAIDDAKDASLMVRFEEWYAKHGHEADGINSGSEFLRQRTESRRD